VNVESKGRRAAPRVVPGYRSTCADENGKKGVRRVKSTMGDVEICSPLRQVCLGLLPERREPTEVGLLRMELPTASRSPTFLGRCRL
jgi:hypothetical protein